MNYDADDPIAARRRQRRAKSRQQLTFILIAGGVLGCVALVVVIGLAVSNRRATAGGDRPGAVSGVGDITTPRPEAAGDWTMKDLRDHLRRNGVPVVLGPGGPTQIQLWVVGTPAEEEEVRDEVDSGSTDDRVILCFKEANPKEAKQLADSSPERKFFWGPYVFSCHDNAEARGYLSRISLALTGRPFRPSR